MAQALVRGGWPSVPCWSSCFSPEKQERRPALASLLAELERPLPFAIPLPYLPPADAPGLRNAAANICLLPLQGEGGGMSCYLSLDLLSCARYYVAIVIILIL